LVVIAIIGVLVAMLLPAVQMAREAARRSNCTQNLHQVALAVQQHDVTFGCYPPGLPNCVIPANFGIVGGTADGAWCQGPTWTVAIMPYLEEQSQFDLIKACMPTSFNLCQDCTQGIVPPPAFLCPSAEQMESTFFFTGVGAAHMSGFAAGIPKGNYVGNFGSDTYLSYGSQLTAGVFDIVDVRGARGAPVVQAMDDPSMQGSWKMGAKLGVKSAMVQDGLSRTILASELLAYAGPSDPRGAWTLGGMGGAAFTTRQPPNPTAATAVDLLSACQANLSTDPMAPPFQFNCDVAKTPGSTYAAARSNHSGGVVAVMVDGSTHFVVDTIDPTIWKNLGTRNGGETADLPPE
jgi:type II secretory pathway pseudopilin PulG